jgi:hypothetical protein
MEKWLGYYNGGRLHAALYYRRLTMYFLRNENTA